MAGFTIYLCRPPERSVPGMRAWVGDAVEYVRTLPGWACSIRVLEYDGNASLSAADLCSEVIGRLGPVVLLEPVQERLVVLLRERLSGRTTVIKTAAYSLDAVVAELEAARQIHESGEPHVCRQYVVALLLMRKLDQERRWAGNAKGYMWVDDIRKGRGLDEQFADAVPPVLSILYLHGLLVQKPSRHSNKYALNPDRREEIYEILRERRFASEQLSTVLHRDRRVISVRHLDTLDCYDAAPIRR